MSFTKTLVERENKEGMKVRKKRSKERGWKWNVNLKEITGRGRVGVSTPRRSSASVLRVWSSRALVLPTLVSSLKVSEGCFQRGGADARMEMERK